MARWSVVCALAAMFTLLLTASGSGAQDASADRILGWRVTLGNGEVASFAELQDSGDPRAVGVRSRPRRWRACHPTARTATTASTGMATGPSPGRRNAPTATSL
jgi:hypothetical protein